MRIRVKRLHYGLLVFVLTAVLPAPAGTMDPVGPTPADAPPSQGDPVDPPTFFLPEPWTLEVATLGDEIDAADITDVEVADFNADGRKDVAIAWFATDLDNLDNNSRSLSVYFGSGTGSFTLADEYDLYVPNHLFEALSVFRNGPADIGQGDFDGDGDRDLAVTPFFGDEIWFLENLGDGTFEQHLKFPFGFNTTGNFQTPPEALAADFDGDGKEDFVCIADPIQYIQGYMIHFWKTDGSIADMYRVRWEGISDIPVQWTRGLAVADFDWDGRPDLCFSGSVNPPEEDDPVLVFWYDLNTETRRFAVQLEYPSFLCSDVVAVQPDPRCPPGVVLTDLDGTQMECWASQCDYPMAFYLAGAESGYAGYGVNRGMTVVLADVDGDGDSDLVTRQKLGGLMQTGQVEVTLGGAHGEEWTLAQPNPVNTAGFQDLPYSEILRPRNLAVADFCGNTLPEIVAAFGPAPAESPGDDDEELRLRAALWRNSCLGDVSCDGRTNVMDLAALLGELSGGDGSPFDPDADLNKDGCVNLADLAIVIGDYGCDCRQNSMPPPNPD